MIPPVSTSNESGATMLEQPSHDPCVVVLMFNLDGLTAYGLRGDGPFFLTQGGGMSDDLRRARRFNSDAQAHTKSRDMKDNYVYVHGALAMRLSEVKKRQVS